MSDKKEVKSKNQSGGITGFNVNVGDNAKFPTNKNESKPPKSKFWKVMGYIAIIATIIAAVIAALGYFEI